MVPNPDQTWIKCLRKLFFDRLYCIKSNIVWIKVVILYCFYETAADSHGSQTSFEVAIRYSDCNVNPPSTPSRMISQLSERKLEVGTVILSDVTNICKRRN